MTDQKLDPRQPIEPKAKFVGGAMGLVFAGIGLTVLAFLWGSRIL